MWFFNQKRADQVAQSISQLIHTLSDGRKNHGPTSPERLLREFATQLSEDTIIGQRVVKLLMATTTKAKFLVSLATAPDHSSHRLTFDGRGVYSGFSLACFFPPRSGSTRGCSTRPARPCPTWSNAATFAGIAETIAVHASATAPRDAAR